MAIHQRAKVGPLAQIGLLRHEPEHQQLLQRLQTLHYLQLLLFSLAPLFDDNDGKIDELLELTSWCNPPDTIAEISDRLELWKDDLEMRADLWPSEPFPAVVDFRKVLVNFRKVLHKSLDTAVIRVREKIVAKQLLVHVESSGETKGPPISTHLPLVSDNDLPNLPPRLTHVAVCPYVHAARTT